MMETKQPLLVARNIRKSYDGLVVLDDVSVTLEPGEVVLLRGPNGSGKTTLLNILTGNLEPDAGLIRYSGLEQEEKFRFPRRGWQRVNPLAGFLPEHLADVGVGRTWQENRLFDSLDLLDNVTVATPANLSESPALNLLRPVSARREERARQEVARSALERFGLSQREKSRADRISLGQAKRVSIARAISAGARVLFLDEPLEGLDHAGIDGVVRLLEGLRDAGITLVIVEHHFNVPLVAPIATSVWSLQGGKLEVERIDAAKDPEEVGEEKSPYRSSYPWAGTARSGVRQYDLKGDARMTVLTMNEVDSPEVVLSVEALTIRRGNRTVIGGSHDGGESGLSFRLRRGELAILEAPNGWGKTSLLDAIAGLLSPESGRIVIGDNLVTNLAPWERFKMGMRYARAKTDSFGSLTVRETLQLARAKSWELEGHETRQVSTLSGGERKRLVLSCALNGPHGVVYLLDEPFEALDRIASERLWNPLREGLESGTVLLAVPGRHKEGSEE